MADIEEFFKPREKREKVVKKIKKMDKPEKKEKVEKNSKEKNSFFHWKKNLKIGGWILAVAMFLLAIGTSIYFYRMYKKALATGENIQKKSETELLLENLGKLIELPTNEGPTIATVTDKTKLTQQEFFQKAQNGDKIIIYTQGKRAILFRPAENKIIDVATLNTSSDSAPADTTNGNVDAQSQTDGASNVPTQNQTSEQTAPAEKTPVNVFVYNGTTMKGIAKSLGEKVSNVEGVILSGTGNAKANYEDTIVVDLTGKNQEIAQKTADSLSAKVGTLPVGETKPDADILVIAGKN